jgi:hypothetical protein
MLNSARFAALIFLAASTFLPGLLPKANAQVGPTTATKLVFYNASNVDIPVGVQVPGLCPDPSACAQEDGCPTQTIQYLRTVDLTAGSAPTPLTPFASTDKGWFLLKRGHRVQFLNVGTNKYTGQPSACLQGMNFGFGNFEATCPDKTAVPPGASQFPVTTPGPTFNQPHLVSEPNGTTGFECTLNLPGTVNGQTTINNPDRTAGGTVPADAAENMNITCLAGANCTLNVQVTPPAAGPFWQANESTTNFRTTTSFQNSWVDIAHKCDNNCVDPKTGRGRLGVFPYGCSQCNKPADPGSVCTGLGQSNAQFCASRNGLPPNNGCKFVRSPLQAGVQKFGGTIQVNYLGPLSPPGTCPPGSN